MFMHVFALLASLDNQNGFGVSRLSNIANVDDILERRQLREGGRLHGELSFDIPEGKCVIRWL